jgi:hypothetical protein
MSGYGAREGGRDRRCQEILTAETMNSYGNFPHTPIGGARPPK